MKVFRDDMWGTNPLDPEIMPERISSKLRLMRLGVQ